MGKGKLNVRMLQQPSSTSVPVPRLIIAASMELVAASRAGAVRVVEEARLRVTVRTEAALPRGAVPPKAPAWSIAETLRNAIKPLRIAIPEIRTAPIERAAEIEADEEKDAGGNADGDGEDEDDEDEERRRRGRAAAGAAVAPVVAVFTLDWPEARAADVARVTAAWQGLSFLVPNVRERLVAAVTNEGAEARAEATAPFKVSGAGTCFLLLALRTALQPCSRLYVGARARARTTVCGRATEWERREAGERPDTVHVERLPIHWFAPATSSRDALAAVARTAAGATVVWGAGVAGSGALAVHDGDVAIGAVVVAAAEAEEVLQATLSAAAVAAGVGAAVTI